MSRSLILMSWAQRLFQVGTCIPRSSSHTIIRTQQVGATAAVRNISSSNRGRILSRRASLAAASLDPVGEFGKREEGQLLLEGQNEAIQESLRNIGNQSEETVITVPARLEKRLERRMVKESRKQAVQQRIIDASRKGGNKAQVVIHCKHQKHNHYVGQSYDRKRDVPLASAGWRHRKAAGDFFTLYPGFKKESPFYMSDTEALAFKDLGISEIICNNLKPLGIEIPTHIQVFGIPEILKGEGSRNIIAAETGCGKTLVYLLPIIQQVLGNRRFKVRPKPGHPSAVVLVPSRELADQIYEVALQLTHDLDISVKLLQGGNLGLKIKNPAISRSVDILIATTNALKVLTSAGFYSTSRLSHLVLDEADTLLDDSFFPELIAPFLNRFNWNDIQRPIQLTLVSATMPNGLDSTLGQIMKTDSFGMCTTPGLHYLLPHVPQKFMRVRKSQKPDQIKDIVQSDADNKIPVMIFCNKSQTCDWLSHYLNDSGIDSVAVHGRMHLKYRKGRIDMYQRGEINVLISTDLASRGIDTVRTRHVINYEFPLYVADYIHRCGRTGRVGSAKGCRVTNLISRPGEVSTVNQIELSVRKEKSLPDVNANIKRLYGLHYGSFVEIAPIRDDEVMAAPADSDDGETDYEKA